MQVTTGAVVSINYTLTDDEGVVIDTNEGHAPLVYLHGHDNIITGLEKGLEGAAAGDKRTVDVAPAEGYGEADPERYFELSKEEFPDELPLEEGMQFCAETPSGEMTTTIAEVRDSTVICDATHPLAGVNLHFAVEILDVREATKDELEAGQPLG
jgi:FKBP-type peptidyl-prolyl cis-trans isomerase SlyD